MVGSLILGWLLSLLGSLCVITGMVVAVLEAVRPKAAGAFPVDWDKLLRFLELIKGILESFGKLKTAAQFLVIGVLLLAAGVYFLSQRPF